MKRSDKRAFGVLLAAALALAGCAGSLITASTVTPGATTSLAVAIAIAAPDPAITGVSLTATPTDGADAVSASRPCAAAGCNVTFAPPIGGETLRVDLTDAQNHIVRSGSLYVFAQNGNSSVGVAFGGTPATIKVSAKPASFTSGSTSSATVRVLAYDAQGNRLIGQIAFPSPVTITSSDTTGTMVLSGPTVAGPNDTLTLSYTGGTAAAATVLTPSSAQGTKVPLNVNVVAPPHKTADGHSGGDFMIPSQEEIEAVPIGPPGITPFVVSVPPVSVDLSAQMPPVGDQGDENSCVGWASGYAIKSSQEALEHKWSMSGGTGPNGINTAHVFSPAYIYNQINGGVDNGSQFLDAFKLLENQGVAPWASMPYVARQYTTQPTAAAKTAAAPYIIASYYSIPKANLAQAKSVLAQGYPIFWGAEVDSNFEGGKFSVLSGPFGVDEGGHAMTIVGYDETKQAFKVMNSWGTGFEQAGYFWVSYDWLQNNGHMSLMYVLIDSPNDPS